MWPRLGDSIQIFEILTSGRDPVEIATRVRVTRSKVQLQELCSTRLETTTVPQLHKGEQPALTSE